MPTSESQRVVSPLTALYRHSLRGAVCRPCRPSKTSCAKTGRGAQGLASDCSSADAMLRCRGMCHEFQGMHEPACRQLPGCRSQAAPGHNAASSVRFLSVAKMQIAARNSHTQLGSLVCSPPRRGCHGRRGRASPKASAADCWLTVFGPRFRRAFRRCGVSQRDPVLLAQARCPATQTSTPAEAAHAAGPGGRPGPSGLTTCCHVLYPGSILLLSQLSLAVKFHRQLEPHLCECGCTGSRAATVAGDIAALIFGIAVISAMGESVIETRKKMPQMCHKIPIKRPLSGTTASS